MIVVIAGTNRPGSRSLQVAQIVAHRLAKFDRDTKVLDLKDVDLKSNDGSNYGGKSSAAMRSTVEMLNRADGLYIVCPEYNGSMPGALKSFIDYWDYPQTFEHRPVALAGLGGRFGGLRPVEHLQQVLGYRNAFIFPERIFITNAWDVVKDGSIEDKLINDLLDIQITRFVKFIAALKSQGLDANSEITEA